MENPFKAHKWEHFAYLASVDLVASHLGHTPQQILVHLRDAADNVARAINELEEPHGEANRNRMDRIPNQGDSERRD
jgi:hypothetical protein